MMEFVSPIELIELMSASDILHEILTVKKQPFTKLVSLKTHYKYMQCDQHVGGLNSVGRVKILYIKS